MFYSVSILTLINVKILYHLNFISFKNFTKILKKRHVDAFRFMETNYKCK